MNNVEFAKEVEKRTLNLGIEIIKMASTLPRSAEGEVIKKQIIRSGTSIGANYWEANRARSKADLRNKIKICESEASETFYWLELFVGCKLIDQKDISHLYNNAAKILGIMSRASKKLREK